jgi:transcriptional activator SPT7
MMNNNIRTTKRVRRIHAKFASLNFNSNGDEGDWASSAPPILGEEEIDDMVDDRPWQPRASGIELGEENAADCLQWMSQKVLEHVGFQGKAITSFPLSQSDVCMCKGATKATLDVLTSVASEYLLNVGRTIHFLSDKYSHSMTAEVRSNSNGTSPAHYVV